jgi:hypothetical protein
VVGLGPAPGRTGRLGDGLVIIRSVGDLVGLVVLPALSEVEAAVAALVLVEALPVADLGQAQFWRKLSPPEAIASPAAFKSPRLVSTK